MTTRRTDIVAPATHLGFEVGADRKLANWQQITSYFYRLAEQSNRILVEEIGKSTAGRSMLLATISAPAIIVPSNSS